MFKSFYDFNGSEIFQAEVFVSSPVSPMLPVISIQKSSCIIVCLLVEQLFWTGMIHKYN
jgi:hypothetical protein